MKPYSQTPKGAYVVNPTLSEEFEDAEHMLVSSIKTQPKAFRFPSVKRERAWDKLPLNCETTIEMYLIISCFTTPFYSSKQRYLELNNTNSR